MTTTLEVCPFCKEGSDLEHGHGTKDREGWPVYVYCGSCGAQGPWVYSSDTTATREADRLWNGWAAGEKFTQQVLDLVSKNDLIGQILWDYDTPKRSFHVLCNDLFFWGSADCEEITPDNIESLQECMDLTEFHGTELFCCRSRGQRPQGAAYPVDKEVWPLFDACGPEREVGFGNPRPSPKIEE